MSDEDPEDEFKHLGRRREPEPEGTPSGEDLAALVSLHLSEPPGRVAVEPQDDEMAWFVRDGERLAWFNLRETRRLSPARRDRLAQGFVALIERVDKQRVVVDPLEPGSRYRVEWKNARIRRTFRQTGVLQRISSFEPAEGVNGGGWSLTFELRPRFGKPSTQTVDLATVTDIRPA